MQLSLTSLTIAAALAVVTCSVAAGAQGYGDPRDAAPGDSRYGDPQADPRDRQSGYPGSGDPRDGDRRGWGGASATFYADDRFRGRSVTLNHGARRLGEIGMEDKISSIRVESGRWLVCEDDDFRGRCVTIDRSIGRLDRLGMDDKISSVRPIRGGDRDDYRGDDGRRER